VKIIGDKEIGEEELAFLCKKRNHSAQKELYTRYATRVFMLCYSFYHNHDDAFDLMHDIMVKVFMSIDQYNYVGEGSLYAWINRLARNLIIDRIRKDSKKESVTTEIIDDADASVTEEASRDIPISVLKKIIQQLPTTKQLIFNLHCVEGLSHKDISSLLGITEKASSSMLSKAKKMLAKRINDYLNKKNRG
jgi:RNA polymerase sigma-70 factor (ECF subfamily)